jgi:hypothetical protein
MVHIEMKKETLQVNFKFMRGNFVVRVPLGNKNCKDLNWIELAEVGV